MQTSDCLCRFLVSVGLILTCLQIPTASAEIKIQRDEYGVPSIETSTNAELFFAYGYAMARDRVIQMTKIKFLLSGSVLNDTILSRNTEEAQKFRNFYLNEYPSVDADIQRQLNALKVEKTEANHLAITVAECIAGGVSLFLSDFQKKSSDNNPIGHECYLGPRDKLPGEFLSFRQRMSEAGRLAILKRLEGNGPIIFEDWTALDVLKIFHSHIMDQISNNNEEIKSFALLKLLESANEKNKERARRIFNSLKWVESSEALAENLVASDDKDHTDLYRDRIHRGLLDVGRPQRCNGYRNAAEFSQSVAGGIGFQSMRRQKLFGNTGDLWAVVGDHTLKGGTSVLYNNPKMVSSDPSSFYPVKLESKEGFRYVGTSYVGTFTPLSGRNDTLAYGFTPGELDQSDIICLPVKKMNVENAYLGNGFKLVPNQALQQRGISAYILENLNWSVPLLDTALHGDVAVAYIKQVAWKGTTVHSFRNFLIASQADTIENWHLALNKVGPNLNMIAVSKQGHASLRVTGAYLSSAKSSSINPPFLLGKNKPQDRSFREKDPRFPYASHRSVQGLHLTRKYYRIRRDVKDGFVSNRSYKSTLFRPDTDVRSAIGFKWGRAEIIEKILWRGRGKWDLQESINFNKWLSRTDTKYNRYLPMMIVMKQILELNEEQASKLEQMLSWNGMRQQYEGIKTGCFGGLPNVHSGEVIFYHWYDALIKNFRKVILKRANKDFIKFWNSQYGRAALHLLNTEKKPLEKTVGAGLEMSIVGKVMLNNLMYALGQYPAFDRQGWNFLIDRPAVEDGSDMEKSIDVAFRMTRDALDDVDLLEIFKCPSLHSFSMTSSQGLRVSYRTTGVFIPYFRNKGAQSQIIEFSADGVRGENVVAPGVREASSPKQSHSTDQLKLFDTDTYRNMGVFSDEIDSKEKIKSRL